MQHNKNCNMHLSGDIEGTSTTMGYKTGLITRFGFEEGTAIIEYCTSSIKSNKWEWQELEEIRKEFNAKIKELEL